MIVTAGTVTWAAMLKGEQMQVTNSNIETYVCSLDCCTIYNYSGNKVKENKEPILFV